MSKGLVPCDDDDPLEYTSWMLKILKNDLFLLENQLPWKVLECLFCHTVGNDKYSLLKLALEFFDSSVFDQTPQIKGGETRHLLDAIRASLISSHQPQSALKRFWELIPTVTELLQAGVKFKSKNSNWSNMPDITFEKGVTEIPPIDIESNAESLFRNLIAYKQFFSLSFLQGIPEHVYPGLPFISVSKGLEVNTLRTMSQIILQTLKNPRQPFIALSRPSSALELMNKLPTGYVQNRNNIVESTFH
ncbi:hypothetical protein PS2_026283 [Malus domestica]